MTGQKKKKDQFQKLNIKHLFESWILSNISSWKEVFLDPCCLQTKALKWPIAAGINMPRPVLPSVAVRVEPLGLCVCILSDSGPGQLVEGPGASLISEIQAWWEDDDEDDLTVWGWMLPEVVGTTERSGKGKKSGDSLEKEDQWRAHNGHYRCQITRVHLH